MLTEQLALARWECSWESKEDPLSSPCGFRDGVPWSLHWFVVQTSNSPFMAWFRVELAHKCFVFWVEKLFSRLRLNTQLKIYFLRFNQGCLVFGWTLDLTYYSGVSIVGIEQVEPSRLIFIYNFSDNFYFYTSLCWVPQRFYEGLWCLYKALWGTTFKLIFSVRPGLRREGLKVAQFGCFKL